MSSLHCVLLIPPFSRGLGARLAACEVPDLCEPVPLALTWIPLQSQLGLVGRGPPLRALALAVTLPGPEPLLSGHHLLSEDFPAHSV